jgi:sulfonate dioxygenase
MTTLTETLPALETLRLRPEAPAASKESKDTADASNKDAAYKYARFLPHFDNTTTYPPLTDFEHHDPGLEALKHDDSREFLKAATVSDVSRSLLFRESSKR